MKKNFTLLFLMFLTLAQLSAQQWVVYDGSVSPDSVFSQSSNNDVDALTAAIIDDPALEGNKLFQYKVVNGTFRWQADLGLPVSGITLVTRVRADLSPGDFHLVNLVMRNGEYRPEIRIESDKLNPSRTSVGADYDIDMTKWHVVRIAFKSDQSLMVYVDEKADPVMVDTSNSTTSNQYIQWGDGSGSDDYGGLIDWMVFDTTGAYAPGEGAAIPDSLSLNSAQSVILITNDSRDDEQYEFLLNNGFDVTKFYPGKLSAAGQDTIDMLNAADLVIIGRSPSSSDFQGLDKEAWNNLTVPLILNAQYDARSSRINWFNSTNAYHSNDGPPVAYGVVSDPSDPIFAGVDLLVGDSVGWCYPAHDFLGLDSTTNGTILVAYAGRNPLVVRFDAGVEFYEGSVDMPAGPRTYFGFGNDNAGEANFFPLTKAAKAAYVAEINRMTGQETQMPIFGTADSRVILMTPDTRDDIQYEWLVRQGFNVTKFYPGKLSAAGQDTIDMLNGSDLVIIGRSASSSDFQGLDKEAWNGLTVPVILNGQYDARSSRINWFNSTNAYHQNDGPAVAYGVVSDPSDAVFAGVTLVGDSLGWCYPAHDFLGLDSTTNGTILAAYAGRNPLLVRFDAGVEFYEGSVDLPAGPRTYFGFGNDNAGAVNFFPLTRDAKKVYLAEISRLVGIAVPEASWGLADFNVTLISDDDQDDPQMNFLEKNSIRVTKFYPGKLGAAGQDTIDMLNAADLVIIGRSPSSSDFQNLDKEAWNNLTVPVILNGQYDARSSRINWFNSTNAYHQNDGPAVAYGVTGMPDDVVFSNVTLDGDSIGMLLPAHDFLGLDSTTNGTIVATYNLRNPLLVRFDAGVEFYPGSVDLPAGARTYFGFGNDNAGFSNFFPLTADGQQVYLNEISRMLGAELSIVNAVSSDASLSALDYSVATATLTPAFSAEVMAYDLQLVQDSSVVDLMATASNEFATVVGDSTIDVSAGDTIMTKIVVTAENGNQWSYSVTVYPYVSGSVRVEKYSDTGSSVKLYPNPASEQLYVESDEEISQVTIFNAIGKVVLEQSSWGTERIQLNIGSLQSGLYLMQVESGGKSSMSKFLKQ